jgi:hypothetical protein
VSSTVVRDDVLRLRTYRCVLVHARFNPAKDPHLRKEVEGALVTRLRTAHIDAAAAVDLEIPDPTVRAVKVDDSEADKARPLLAGFDGVLEVEVRVGKYALGNVGMAGTFFDAKEVGYFDGMRQNWEEQWMWLDEVELRSAGWTIEAVLHTGAARLAEDLIASGLLSAKLVPSDDAEHGLPPSKAGP